MDRLKIHPLADPACLAALATDAEADGRRMVSRLIQEWVDGSNRFDQPGERVYYAMSGAQVCGVCGLNRDPFATTASVGRIRRLYVSVDHRRRGVASALVEQLADDARSHFRVLQLRTYDANASAFYEAIGFARVDGDPTCTHRRVIAGPTR